MEAIFEFIGMLLDALFGERFEKWSKKRFKSKKLRTLFSVLFILLLVAISAGFTIVIWFAFHPEI
jgi:hypothetical protein